MATTRTASAHWEGSLMEGAGKVSLESSGVGTFDVSWPSRAEAANGKTSPEELIAAAHSTCYSMALSNGLAKAGTPPTRSTPRPRSPSSPARASPASCFKVLGDVPGISAAQFEEAAQAAKTGCPVSQALSAVPISLEVSFAGEDRA